MRMSKVRSGDGLLYLQWISQRSFGGNPSDGAYGTEEKRRIRLSSFGSNCECGQPALRHRVRHARFAPASGPPPSATTNPPRALTHSPSATTVPPHLVIIHARPYECSIVNLSPLGFKDGASILIGESKKYFQALAA